MSDVNLASLQSNLNEHSRRWQLQELIGAGGMGEVYKAHDSVLSRAVAIKIPRVAGSGAKQLLEEASKHARAGQHPNVVQIHDCFQFGDSAAIILEWVDSARTLKDEIEEFHATRRPTRNQRAVLLGMLTQVCDGIQHIHSQAGLIHGDLKPSNILIGPDQTPLICDFGLSRFRTDNEASTGLTGPYAAPEQWQTAADLRSDVYSLGVVLYEVLTGVCPFSGTPEDLLDQKWNDPPEPPSALVPDIHPRLDEICIRCLQHAPGDRFSNPTQLSTELAPFASPCRAFNVPHDRNEFFYFRDSVFAEIDQALKQSAHRRVLISGLGGIGKTQTAVEYINRSLDRYSAVLWLQADLQVDLQFASLSALVEPILAEERSFSDRLQITHQWLSNNDNWLLVFDNVGPPESITAFLPRNPQGDVLITSRAGHGHLEMLGIREAVQLPGLSIDESLSFLVNRTDRNQVSSDERKHVREIVEEFHSDDYGVLPLALEQAAAYIRQSGDSFKDYIQEYRARRLDLLEDSAPQTGDYPDSVFTTWAINFSALDANSTTRMSRMLLEHLSFLEADRIPLELISGILSRQNEPPPGQEAGQSETSLFQVNRILEPLARYSLIRIDRRDLTVSTHRLVQEVLRTVLDEEQETAIIRELLSTMNRVFPFIEFRLLPYAERLVPHGMKVAEEAFDKDISCPDAGQMISRIAAFHSVTGDYNNAEHFAELARQHVSLNPESARDVVVFQALTEVAAENGQFQKAVSLALAGLSYEGTDSELVSIQRAFLFCALGKAYQGQHRYAEARDSYLKAKQRFEQLDLTSIRTYATCLNNLATVHEEFGELSAAESLLREALRLKIADHGMLHPETARVMGNLAACLGQQKEMDPNRDCSEALELTLKAFRITADVVPESHPFFFHALENKAVVNLNCGKTRDAREILERAIELAEAHIPDTPKHLSMLQYLAIAYARSEENSKADLEENSKADLIVSNVLSRSDQLCTEGFPSESSWLLIASDIAGTAGNERRQVELLQSVWKHEEQQRTLGEVEYLNCGFNLALGLLEKINRVHPNYYVGRPPTAAVDDAESAISKLKSFLEYFRDTRETKRRRAYVAMSQLYSALQRWADAVECFRAALLIRSAGILLDSALDDATLLHVGGSAHMQLEEFDEAISCFEQALELYPKDSSTVQPRAVTLENLGTCHEKLEQYDAARQRFTEIKRMVSVTVRAHPELGPQFEFIQNGADLDLDRLPPTSNAAKSNGVNRKAHKEIRRRKRRISNVSKRRNSRRKK